MQRRARRLCAAGYLFKNLGADVRAEESPLERLTGREPEVLRPAARGLKHQEIVGELSPSIRSVQTHLSNILAQSGVGSRTEAVLEALIQNMAVEDWPAKGAD
jgi:DNA-binding NarL/FixJ family response regulator